MWQTLAVDEQLFDVAVVGSGPAGALAAYVAAQRGLRVALIDRQTFPRDKTCGDGIGPGAVEVAQRVGLGEIFDGDIPIDSIQVTGPDGAKLEGTIPSIDGKAMQGFVIPRLDFDERLFRHAVKEGAHDLTGLKFTGIADSNSKVRTIRLQDKDHTERSVSAYLLIGADGAHSAVRKALGAPTVSPKHMGIAMRAYSESNAFQEGGSVGRRLLFEFSRELLPSYGWVFPTGKGLVNIGVGGPLVELQNRGLNPKQLLNGFADSMRNRGIELGSLNDQRAYHLPQFAGMPRLDYPRAVLIGDAASMINPVSGEGIAYGMAAAARLIEILPNNLCDRDALSVALARFDSDFRQKYRPHIVSSLLAHRMMRSPMWAKMVVRAAQRDPEVLRDAIDLLFGFGRIRGTTAARIVRFGW